MSDPKSDTFAIMSALSRKLSEGALSLGPGLELDDGRLLGAVAESVAEAHSGTVEYDVREDDLEAVNLVADSFEEGAARISADDTAESGRTLGDLVASWGLRNRPVEPVRDVALVMDYLAACEAGGNGSFHADDEMDDGRLLKDVVWGISSACPSGIPDGVAADELAVVTCMADTFGSGFDLARSEDFISQDDLTIRDVVAARGEAVSALRP